MRVDPRDDPGRSPASPLTARRPRGGVLLRYCEDGAQTALAFIPANVAAKLTALSALTEVPGTRPPAKGIALAEGEVVTVLELGKPPPSGVVPSAFRPGDDWPVPGADRAVLCVLGGQRVALTGGVVLATGLFDMSEAEDGVLWCGELVRTLDVRALYAQAETAIWAERAVSSRPGERISVAPSLRFEAAPQSSQALRPPLLPDVGRGAEEPVAPPISRPVSSEPAPPTAPSPGGNNAKTGGST